MSLSKNVEVTVCSCPAQFGYVPCTCSLRIPWDPDEEANVRLGIRLDPEIFRDTGVCVYCGCVEAECECLEA